LLFIRLRLSALFGKVRNNSPRRVAKKSQLKDYTRSKEPIKSAGNTPLDVGPIKQRRLSSPFDRGSCQRNKEGSQRGRKQ